MKKTIVGLFVLSVTVVIILTLYNYSSFLTAPKPAPEETVVEQAHSTIAEQTHGVEVAEDETKPFPAPTQKIIIKPLTEEFAFPRIAPENVTIAEKQPAPIPEEKQQSPQSMSKTVPEPASVIPNRPKQNFGLLTDTSETEENEIVEPQSTQVHPSISRKGKRKAEAIRVQPLGKESQEASTTIILNRAHPFIILLDAFDRKSNAQDAIAFYRKRGITAFLVRVNLGGSLGVKYRLFNGMFPSEIAAKTFLAQHHLTGKLIKKASHVDHIGTFNDKNELATSFAKTAEAGAFPYIHGPGNGPFSLYVGLFYSAETAEDQCRDLIDKNLPCKTIPLADLP